MVKSLKILVIDDDQTIRCLAKSILQKAGYEVRTAESGSVGLELFDLEPDSFALAIIDESMSVMTGQETISKIRKIRPGFPCVISSGHTLLESDILPELRENTHILGKPYKASNLKEMVKAILGNSSEEADNNA